MLLLGPRTPRHARGEQVGRPLAGVCSGQSRCTHICLCSRVRSSRVRGGRREAVSKPAAVEGTTVNAAVGNLGRLRYTYQALIILKNTVFEGKTKQATDSSLPRPWIMMLQTRQREGCYLRG